MKRHLFILPFLALPSACLQPTTTTCTLELRGYPIAVNRDAATPFARAAELTFKVCAGTRCETLKSSGAASDAGAPLSFGGGLGGVFSGTLSAKADGSTHLDSAVQVTDGETSSPTHVTVRATDAAGNAVIDVAGDVHWENVSCHPKPLDNHL